MRNYLLFSVIFFLMITVPVANACDQPSYLLFRNDAQERLDSLNAVALPDNMIERAGLMHNIAFHKNKEMRKESKKLIDKYVDQYMDSLGWSPIIGAYAGSLRMIKVRDRGKLVNIGKSFITLGGLLGSNPYQEAYEGFDWITEALEQDSANVRIRMIRASAAVESVEHLDKLLSYAFTDLIWLSVNAKKLDSSETFFLYLTWVKYCFKKDMLYPDDVSLERGCEYVELAWRYACSEDYIQEIAKWEDRIDSAMLKK